MRSNSFHSIAWASLAACAFALSAGAQDHQHKMQEAATVQADARQLVIVAQMNRGARDHGQPPAPGPHGEFIVRQIMR